MKGSLGVGDIERVRQARQNREEEQERELLKGAHVTQPAVARYLATGDGVAASVAEVQGTVTFSMCWPHTAAESAANTFKPCQGSMLSKIV